MPELIPFALLVLYLLPFLAAAVRNHDMLLAILVANVLLGWTILGWFVLLAAALVVPVDSSVRARRT